MIRPKTLLLPVTRKRPANPWTSFGACLACLLVMGALIEQLFASPEPPKEESASPTATQSVKVVAADNGKPKLTVTADGEQQKVREVLPDAEIILNGSPVTLDDIAPGDVVNLETDDKGRI